MIAQVLAKARADARSVKLLAPVLVKSQPKTGGTFTPAQPGTACAPMRPQA
jgi:hypothetical protein